MKKTTICITLLLAMLISLFAACGGAPAQADPDESTAAPTDEAVNAPADPDAGNDAPDDSQAPPEEPGEFQEVVYDLPLTDEPVVYTMLAAGSPANTGIELKDNLVIKELQERTGITLEIEEVSAWSYTQQFALHMASGDWTDILTNVRTTYNGGLAMALNEGIIIDLGEYSDYFPNYYHLINSSANVLRDCTLGDGEIGAFYGIFEEPRPIEAGLLVRDDWMEELNMETPTTVDELYDVLKAMHNYNGSYMFLSTNGFTMVLPAFDVAGFFIDAGFFTSLQCYTVEDGQLICGYQDDGFKQYLMTMNKWYSEGLIDPDYMSSTSSSNYLSDSDAAVADLVTDKISVWCDSVDRILYDSADPNFAVRPIPMPTVEKGDDVKCGEYISRVDMDYYSLSSTCENPELICQFFDYSYTTEGSELQCWGIEGETFAVNDDGSYYYTELITDNPDYTITQAKGAYLGGNACLRRMDAYHALHNDLQMECFDVWNSNFTGEHSVSGNLVMTTEESTRFSEISGDLVTYLYESIARFITGEKNFEGDYDEFLSTLTSLGLDELNDIEQAVYDRWASIGG